MITKADIEDAYEYDLDEQKQAEIRRRSALHVHDPDYLEEEEEIEQE